MGRVLVTGVSGRVGANVARTLRDRGHEVAGMAMPDDPLLESKRAWLDGIDVRIAHLTDTASIAGVVVDVDQIVHCAARLDYRSISADAVFDTNALGTQRLLEAATRLPNGLDRFVLSSTDGTYGYSVGPKVTVITEDRPQLASDTYGLSKVLAERIVRAYGRRYDIGFEILRFATIRSPDEAVGVFRYSWYEALFGTYELGPRGHLWEVFRHLDDPVGLIRRAIGDSASTDPAVALVDDEDRPWSIPVSDVRDVVGGIVAAVEQPAPSNDAYHIVSPASVDFDRGARIVSEAVGVPIRSVRMPVRWAYRLATTKAARAFGFTPSYDFATMVDDGQRLLAGATDVAIPASGR